MTKESAKAIVIKDNCALLLYVEEDGKKFYTIPGGKCEQGETPEDTVVRELFEETSIRVGNPNLLKKVKIEDGDYSKTFKLFLCDYVSGEPSLGDSPEKEKMKRNPGILYRPEWVSIEVALKSEITPKALSSHFKENLVKLVS